MRRKIAFSVAKIKLFVAYSSVSVFVTCIDLLTLRTMLYLHQPQALSVSVAFLSANFVQFSLYRWVVFGVAHRSIATQGIAYIVSLGVALLLTLTLVTTFTHVFGLSTMLAKVYTIPIVFPLGFIASKLIIFRK